MQTFGKKGLTLENKLFIIAKSWLFKPTNQMGSPVFIPNISTIMIKFWIIGVILAFSTIAQAEQKNPQPAFMPVPAEIIMDDGKCHIDSSFMISVKGESSQRLYKASSRMLHRLTGRTGLFLAQPHITEISQKLNAIFEIQVKRAGDLALYEDESYYLSVKPGKILLTAETDLGALRGMETFLQMLTADETGYYAPAAEIRDAPRFPWRGLMIDAGRHFLPIEVIKRNLDGMAAVKLNVMHWHLTEDQGFRVESKVYPKLHELGSDGYYYTQDQIRDIITYAADRGIRVVPEFDLPGHATSWLVAYPELASAPGPYQIERGWGIFDPTFNPTLEETYTFLDNFLSEMSQIFPDDYMHIGGDENNGKQWDANPDIQAFMKANDIPDNHTLQSYFNRRLLEILTKYEKRMVGWEEILHPDMPKNIVIQSWRGAESLIEAAKMGYQVMLSRGYYIDLIQPTDFHYLNDPVPDDAELSPDALKLIIGGEATMWSEFVSPETVDSRIWPRTAAIAERLWSAPEVRDVKDMYRRLDVVSFRLEELGLLHEKNYPMMLRRLTNDQDIEPLRVLVDVIEPVKIYTRNQLRKQFSHTPLTRVVDAARPDAKTARIFRQKVAAFIAGETTPENVNELKTWLSKWQSNHEQLIPIIRNAPVLFEIEPMSANLSAAAKMALEAIACIENSDKPVKKWVEESNKLLSEIKKPVAQTELMIVPSLESLLRRAVSEK